MMPTTHLFVAQIREHLRVIVGADEAAGLDYGSHLQLGHLSKHVTRHVTYAATAMAAAPSESFFDRGVRLEAVAAVGNNDADSSTWFRVRCG